MAAASSSSVKLQGKLHDRHVETILAFQRDVRETCQQADVEEMQSLTDLRTNLTVHRTTAEEHIHELELHLSHGRDIVSAQREQFQHRSIEAPVVPLEDMFHRDGVKSMETRQAIIKEEREKLLRTYVELRQLHRVRMELIDNAERLLQDMEAKRRANLRLLMEKLMHDLSIVAYTGVTESQVLVQRAVAAINEQLVANQRTCKTLISQLKQHELLKQRDYSEKLAMLFRSLLVLARDSATLWTEQLLASSSFRAPRSRVAMLKRIQSSFQKTKQEVTHALQGVNAVVETLRRVRSPTNMLETCGGTEPNGWLRSFNDDVFKPVFSDSPTVVAEEWRVFIDVILHNAQCSVVTMTEDTESLERQLQSEMRRVCDCLNELIEDIHTPTEAEIEWITQGSLDGEHLYPFQNFSITDVVSIEEGKRLAHENLQPLCSEITDESSWFKRSIAQNLQAQKNALDDALSRGNGNVVKTFYEATVAIKTTAEKPLSYIRQFYVTQFENQKDYEDQLSWYERDVADVTYRLQHAGTLESARQLCIDGMKILEDIERLYVRYHKQRVGPMTPSLQETDTILDAETKEMLVKLNVAPKQDLEKSTVSGDDMKSPSSKKVSRLSTAALQQNVTMMVPTLDTITLPDGTSYCILGPIKFGQDEGAKNRQATSGSMGSNNGGGDDAANIGSASQGSQTPRDAATAKKPAPKPPAKAGAGGAPSPKVAAAASAAAEDPNGPSGGDADGGVLVNASSSSTALTPKLKFFTTTVTPLLDEVFFDGCVYPESVIDQLRRNLRVTMLEWLVQLRGRVTNSMRTYCDTNKKSLDRQMNECIRRHQRRAPTLQAQTYESRVRELHDGQVSRAKYFEFLANRGETMKTTALQHRQACSEAFQVDITTLREVAQTLITVTSAAALESHLRGFNEKLKKAKQRSQTRQEEGVKQLENTAASIQQECSLYINEKLKSFDNGGSMSAEEVITATEQLRSIMSRTEELKQQCAHELQQLTQEQQTQLENARTEYEKEKHAGTEELRFFSEVQEVLAQHKGRVSNQITLSSNAQHHIDDLLQDLETLLSNAPTRVDASNLGEGLGSLFNADASAPLETVMQRYPEAAAVPEDWSGSDEMLSSRLIKTQLQSTSLVRQSVPAKLLSCVEDLRKSVFVRGVFLGCLAYGVEYVPMMPDTYLEPRREVVNNNNNGGAKDTGAAAAAAAADSKKPNPKGKSPVPKPAAAAAASPSSPASQAATNIFGQADAAALASQEKLPSLPKVVRADVEVSRWSATCKEHLATLVHAYFQAHPHPLARKGTVGSTAEEVLETGNTRVTEQEQRSALHVTEATRKYREQVQRLYVVMHNCAPALFAGLVGLSVSSLRMRLEDVLHVFNTYFTAMLTARRKHSDLLKGSLALPANRSQLEGVIAEERKRQAQCKSLLERFQFIAHREVQDESGRVALRVCHSLSTLFTMLRGIVTPEHVQPGEDVITGEHKGLKRLLRQRMREEAARLLDGGGASGASPGKKETAKKPEPKPKPSEKAPAKGGKGGKGGEASAVKDDDEIQLAPLEKPLSDYAGVVINGVRVFSRFRSEHPSLTIPNHYLRPSQWDTDRAAQAQDSADAVSPDQAKKGAAATAAAAKAPAKPAGGKAVAPPPTSPSSLNGGGEEDLFSPSISGPRDRLHQQAVLMRQNTLESFVLLCNSVSKSASTMFKSLESLEDIFSASWEDASQSLIVTRK